MDQPPATPDERPPVPAGTHRRARRRRRAARWAWWGGWAVVALSVPLAVFVHRGLLGIAGLVAAAAVGYIMLHPRNWLWPDDDEGEEVTEESPGGPGRSAPPPP